jgi:hypothetical protein
MHLFSKQQDEPQGARNLQVVCETRNVFFVFSSSARWVKLLFSLKFAFCRRFLFYCQWGDVLAARGAPLATALAAAATDAKGAAGTPRRTPKRLNLPRRHTQVYQISTPEPFPLAILKYVLSPNAYCTICAYIPSKTFSNVLPSCKRY